MSKVRLFSILMLVSLVTMLSGTAARAATPGFVAGEVIIQYRDGTAGIQHQEARRRVNAAPRERLRGPADGTGLLELISLPTGANVQAAIATLRVDPAVAFAEPNWIYTTGPTATRMPDDPYLDVGYMWGMYGDADSKLNPDFHLGGNSYGSQANEAWASGQQGSRDVAIGVIDEGIEIAHPELAANIWTNLQETGPDANGIDRATNRVDDDSNGYVDDVHGWDFHNNDNSVYDGTEDNHGTHVAGTIGAVGNNNAGVAGVNWAVTMVPAKFLGPSGGSTSNAVKALDYLVTLKTRNVLNIAATNNSWGGGGYSQALHDAIIRAANVEILFVAAAGNNNANNDLTPRYPSSYDTTKGTTTQAAAAYDAVISVAAIDEVGKRASFSNYGRKSVDLGAPGVSIVSTVPSGGYAYYSGTSMATPHVTGAVALYAAKYPATTGAEMRNALLRNTLGTTSISRITVTGGRLDVSCVLNTYVLSASGVPTATCKR